MDATLLPLLVAIARANGSNPDEAADWSERVAAIYDEAAKEAEPPVSPPPPPSTESGAAPAPGPIAS